MLSCLTYWTQREQTIEGACRWKADLDQKVTLADGSQMQKITSEDVSHIIFHSVRCFVSMCDMENQINDNDLNNFIANKGFVDVIRASAKANFGIEETFAKIVRKVNNLP
ncbi:hypothetical protein DICVIV_12693 [Dictyocaulus viviparus]|uniref:Uncharacterized protein n=1 Tax=Dictyocaulus viviparus TaxID=29172 RepID=A0A0D8XC45_DICVI|nr:hypothetical protein DICVIV_12693 [Dictyocaulus viviparus]